MTDTTTGQTTKQAPKRSAGSTIRDGRAWRVTDRRAGLIYMADDDQIAAMARGDRIPLAERAWKEAPAGAIVTDLPAVSVPGLLAAGWIEPADDSLKGGGRGGQ